MCVQTKTAGNERQQALTSDPSEKGKITKCILSKMATNNYSAKDGQTHFIEIFVQDPPYVLGLNPSAKILGLR
jgi:hypothetical protein